MGAYGLSGGFIRPRIKSGATIFHAPPREGRDKKRGMKSVLGVQLKLEFCGRENGWLPNIL
jgi:hypothetical protein